MSKKPTKNNKYRSKRNPLEYINAAKYIAEIQTLRLQSKNSKIDYDSTYKKELHNAKTLLKFFSALAIINVVNNPSSFFWSLNSPQCHSLVEKEAKSLNTNKPTIEAEQIIEKPRQIISKPGILGKLRDL